MKKRFLSLALVAIAMTLFLSGWGGYWNVPEAAAQQPIKWRIQVGVPSASLYFDLVKKFADRIDKMSAGRLKAEVLPDGAVVQAFEILDAVHKGVVEAGFGWTNWWSGKHPAAVLFSSPPVGSGAGMDQLSHVAWLFEGGGNQLYKELYAEVLKLNVEGFLCQPMGPDPLGWFKQPFKNIEEFTKMKYRSPPGIHAEVFQEMGVSTVTMPGGELVTAAQRGVLDAAEWIAPADDMNLGLHTFWKFYYLQGLHQTTDIGEISIHKPFWNKLPPDLQEIIKGAAMASIAETYIANVYKNAVAVKTLQEQHGVKILDTPSEFYPKYMAAANKVYDKYAAKDAYFKKVLDSQRQFAALVVPYWTKVLDLYKSMGETALQQKK